MATRKVEDMRDKQIWCSGELWELILEFKAKCIGYGKEPPTTKKITIIIARNINKDKMWQNEFNKL